MKKGRSTLHGTIFNQNFAVRVGCWNPLPQTIRLLEGVKVETLFGKIPFENGSVSHGSSLRSRRFGVAAFPVCLSGRRCREQALHDITPNIHTHTLQCKNILGCNVESQTFRHWYIVLHNAAPNIHRLDDVLSCWHYSILFLNSWNSIAPKSS